MMPFEQQQICFGKNKKKNTGIGWWTQDLESKTWKVTHNWWSSFFIQSFYQLSLSTCHHSVQWTFMIIDFEYGRIHHTLIGMIPLPKGQNPLSYYILYNESKHNILALVGKANKYIYICNKVG
jgi:hypothetical protein